MSGTEFAGISKAAATSKALTHELFYEYANDNVIGEQQLRLLVKDMVSENPGIQLPHGRDIKQTLKFLDKDGNGLIDESEFTSWLSNGALRSEADKQRIREKGYVHASIQEQCIYFGLTKP